MKYRWLPDGMLQFHEGEHRTFKATMAYAFADHMILAVMQGSTMGENIARLMEHPHEQGGKERPPPVGVIVKVACDLAEHLYAEMSRRGFIVRFEPPAGEWLETES